MPTYEYVCSKCQHHFELSQRITAKPLKICPEALCHLKPWGKGNVTRAISTGGGLIFKGSGFYSTDYRSENNKAGEKKEAASASSGSSQGAKKDAKSTDSAAPKTPAPAPATPAKPSSPKSD